MFTQAFLTFFRSRTPETQRAMLWERLTAYLDQHAPLVETARDAAPPAVREAWDAFVDSVQDARQWRPMVPPRRAPDLDGPGWTRLH
jgi:hypothetical protein